MKHLIKVSLIIVAFGMSSAFAAGAVPKTVLVEYLGATWCGPCKQAAKKIEDELKPLYHPPYVLWVRYYTSSLGGTLANAETDARHAYYGVTAVPTFVINGVPKTPGITGLEDEIEERLPDSTNFSISASYYVSNDTFHVKVTSKLHASCPGCLSTLRVVLMENDLFEIDDIPYTNVVRRVVDAGDVTLHYKNEKQTLYVDFPIETGWIKDNLQAVAFIQVDPEQDTLATQVLQSDMAYWATPGYHGKISGHIGILIPTDQPDDYEVMYVPIIDFAWQHPWWWIEDPYDPWEIEFEIGYNPLRAKEGVGVENSFIVNANLDLRYMFLPSRRVSPYVGAGPGYYRCGDTNAFGFNGSAGVDYHLTQNLSLELGANFHYLLGPSSTHFVQTCLGLLWEFGKARRW